MKGLYLSAPEAVAEAEALQEALGAPCHRVDATLGDGCPVSVLHLPGAWPRGGPVFRDEAGRTVVASGWFVYRGRFNDLEGLARALLDAVDHRSRRGVLAGIDAGAFLLLVHDGRESWAVTDAFGLHPHYRREGPGLGRIAPYPAALSAGLEPEPRLASILAKTGQLFGDLTAWAAITRLTPGSVVDAFGPRPWFEYAPEGRPAEALARMSEGLAPLPRPRLLALSGGLDSRLILAADRAEYGYTFGPRDRGDRPVARRFAHRFERYAELSLLELAYPERVRRAALRMFEGLCPDPFAELLVVHRWASVRFGRPLVFLDGYGGDSLQRAMGLTWGGLLGSAAKLVPGLALTRFDPTRVLAGRYPRLSPAELEEVVALQGALSAGWDLDAPRRLLLFEILHGRVARHALNGGTLMSGQFFLPVQPFCFHGAFRAFFAASAQEGLRWQALHEIWSAVPEALARPATYAGFSPRWGGDAARAVMLATKALGHAGLLKRAQSYEIELPRLRWREERDPSAAAGGAG